MQLHHAHTSPYVRKVMVTAHLLGLAEDITLLPSAAHPIQRDASIAPHNPVAKVPTLILSNGETLYDSRVICEYLDSLRPDYGLFPVSGSLRWKALGRQALGDALLDAALLARYESFARPPEKQWEEWLAGQLVKIRACLDVIEEQASTLAAAHLTIGEVTLACALGYLDFRFAEMHWRETHPHTAGWSAQVQLLPAFQATVPFAP